MPTEKYAHALEILEHCQRIGKQFGLYEHALFHTEVTDLEWDAEASRWIVRTTRGDEFTAQFLAMGTGPLHVPGLPGIPGIESFGGHSFHTSRWDYGYTGGDSDGAPMDKLGDKRAAIVGTGATAVQCIPHLAQACGELYVFQRTPSSVDVRDNRPTDPDWFAEIATWVAAAVAGELHRQPDRSDGRRGPGAGRLDRPRPSRPQPDRRPPAGADDDRGHDGRLRGPDFEKMSEIRSRVDAVVERRETAQNLKAWCTGSCASGRASTTSTSRPSTGRTSTSSTPTARASSTSPMTPWSLPAWPTRSTASSTRRASRSAPPTPAGPATT